MSSEHHGEEVSTEKSLSVHNILKWHWFPLYTSMHAVRTTPVAHIQRNVYGEFKAHMFMMIPAGWHLLPFYNKMYALQEN